MRYMTISHYETIFANFGFNTVCGFNLDKINHILDIYRVIYNKGLNISQALEYIEEEVPATDERDEIITFIRDSGRGIIKRFYKGALEED